MASGRVPNMNKSGALAAILFPAALFVFAVAAAGTGLVSADLGADDRSGGYNLPIGEIPEPVQFLEFPELVVSCLCSVLAEAGNKFHFSEGVVFTTSAADDLQPQPFRTLSPFSGPFVVVSLPVVRVSGRVKIVHLAFCVCRVAGAHEALGGWCRRSPF